MTRLSDESVVAGLSDLPGWSLAGDAGPEGGGRGIEKSFELTDFPTAIAFVVRVGFLAEAADHHPDLDVRWRTVRVFLTTHDAGGLTNKDLALAGEIEGVGVIVTVLVLVAIGVLVVALVLAVAFERGPTPGDVALAYELAWDRLDFTTIWTLSSTELRDGRDRNAFVTDKQTAYRDQPRLRAVVERVEIEAVAQHDRRAASVLTRLELRDEPSVRNEVRMQRIHGSWRVVSYALRPEPASTA